jgi:hypothetical protein
MAIPLTLRAIALITIAVTSGTWVVSPVRMPSTPPALAPADPAPVQARTKSPYGTLPLSFEVNQGQSDGRVEFLARGQGYSLFLTASEAVLSLHPAARHGSRADAVVRMRLAGANPRPQLAGLELLPGTSNYFIGSDPRQWRRDVPSYARVKYAGVYPGIDLVYYGNQRQLEYDLLVAPHADPRRITLAFDGVRALSLDADGNLILQTAGGEIAQHKPVIYQDIDGTRQKVDGRYVLRANHSVGFDIDGYDTTEPLVIDPVLSYSTYLGGTGNDIGHAIAVDAAGNAYVTGVTTSTNFPGASTSLIQSASTGSNDVFVTKLNPSGSALVYSTYLGGSNGEIGYAIAVDGAGNAYVTGETDSGTQTLSSIPFPTVGAFDSTYNGGGDAFVTKINASGNALVYSTFLGGGGNERGYGIAVDSAGSAYVTGHTSSDNASSGGPAGGFPTVGALQANNASLGNSDAFVTKFSAAGNALVYSTYLGGNGSEFSIDGGAIAVDSDGNAYVGGTTRSSNFPGASSSTIQPAWSGTTGRSDGFVVKLNAAGSALLYSTYLGGTTDDSVNGIAIDGARNAYVVGSTESPNNFPTASPLQAAKGGTGFDAFVTKINAAGTALVYSTYLGGSDGENAYAVAVDASGNAFVSGWTASSNFPTVAPLQAAAAGSGDAFISEVNAAGNALVYSTYFGAQSGTEHAYGIGLDGAGVAYVTGDTNSTNFPTASPLQATRSGSIGTDAFVARIIGNPPFMSIDRVSLNFAAVTTGAAFTSQTSAQTVRLIQGSGPSTVTWTAVSTTPWLVVSPSSGSGSASLTISTKFAPGLNTSQSGAITLTFTGSANAGSPINVTLTTVSSTAAASLPFGVFDTPAGDATVLAGSIAVTGWTLDNTGVKRVELWRDLVPGETTPPFASTPADPRTGKVFIANATFVEHARPDVELLYPTTPFAYRAGWGYLLLTWGLWNQGNGTYKFFAFAFDQEDNVATIGTKTVIISNNAATKPFGSIDTPGIGGDASGPNFGWGLTPKVNGVATCKIQASGVQVSIDSGPLQPVAYGDARTDIAGAFPGFSNSAGAGGHYIFDWSTLTNGSHTIGWLISDDCNRVDGVGSRFFNVTGGTNLIAADALSGLPLRLAAPNQAALRESDAAITVARGYGELPLVVDPGLAGSRTIEVKQGERVELRLPRGFDTAYQLGPGGQPRALPTGSTWDAASGIFYWHPAQGFFGRYRIVFSDGRQKISVRVVIVP